MFINETRSVEFDLLIRACQRDVIRHFGSSYCYNDKFIIYPSNVIEKLRNKYLGSTVQRLITKETHILNGTIVNLSMRTINREQGLELKIILNALKRYVNA